MNFQWVSRWPFAITALFVGWVVWLVGMTWSSQHRLREAAVARVVASQQVSAATVGEALQERLREVEGLAGSHQLDTYLANLALGMSPRYGLDASREAVAAHLAAQVGRRDTVFERLLFVDERGVVVADTAPGQAVPGGVVGATARWHLDPGARRVVVWAPVLRQAQVVARLAGVCSTTALAQPSLAGPLERVVLVDDGGRVLAGDATGLPSAAALAQLPPGVPTAVGDGRLALSSPVPAFSGALVALGSEAQLGGGGVSGVLVALTLMPLVLLAMVAALVQSRREATALQGTNVALTEDITRRVAVERQLREQQDRLEHLAEELKAAVAAAERANQAKSDFIATVSHEVRTPLNGILGLTELARGTSLDATQAEYLAGVHASAQVLLGLINDLLDFSKMEADRLTLETIPFDPRRLLADVCALHFVEAQKKGLAFSCEVTPEVAGQLLGDPLRVRQVVQNLVGNAVKFTAHGRVDVRLEVATRGPGVQLTVRDTGAGIDAATRARLFSPFTPADSSMSRRFGGTGLGLSIARRLARLMGGDVELESAPGEGSVFTARLALAPTVADPRPALAEGTDQVGAGCRVLVVEDNRINQTVVTRMLSRLGAEASVAEDGVAALDLLRGERFDLVLMDCQMPKMDGYEATRRARAGEAGEGARHLPIIALTANAMQSDREACLAAGMTDFLAKPLTLTALAGQLERWVRQR